MRYIDYLSHLTPRSNMMCNGVHTYVVGQYRISTPTTEQSTALRYTGNIGIFSRLLKDGVLYHSTNYTNSTSGKRNNTHCCYQDKANNCIYFGQIELFTTCPRPHAFVRPLCPLGTSMLTQAGHPCRSSLAIYQRIDLLSTYIVPVLSTTSSPLIAVSVDCIISKIVTVSVLDKHYCVVQPNNIERH